MVTVIKAHGRADFPYRAERRAGGRRAAAVFQSVRRDCAHRKAMLARMTRRGVLAAWDRAFVAPLTEGCPPPKAPRTGTSPEKVSTTLIFCT